jgi:hypothetical protein
LLGIPYRQHASVGRHNKRAGRRHNCRNLIHRHSCGGRERESLSCEFGHDQCAGDAEDRCATKDHLTSPGMSHAYDLVRGIQIKIGANLQNVVRRRPGSAAANAGPLWHGASFRPPKPASHLRSLKRALVRSSVISRTASQRHGEAVVPIFIGRGAACSKGSSIHDVCCNIISSDMSHIDQNVRSPTRMLATSPRCLWHLSVAESSVTLPPH